jgi:hypothetical protein
MDESTETDDDDCIIAAELFDVPGRRVLGVYLREDATPTHVFGGPPLHRGVVPPGCKRPMHLLFEFDLSDEELGLRIPGVTRLPLYYPFFHWTEAVGYRVVSETEIKVLTRGHQERDPDDPESPASAQLPFRSAEVFDPGFDLLDPEFALSYTGIFPLDSLSKQDQKRMCAAMKQRYHELTGLEPPRSVAELVYYFGSWPFWQGRPQDPCPDPTCPNHTVEGSMHVLLLMRETRLGAGVQLFDGYGRYTRIIFLICPRCHALIATNECT